MLEKLVAVVGGENDDGALAQIVLLQSVDDAPELRVAPGDGEVVEIARHPDHLLRLLWRHVLDRAQAAGSLPNLWTGRRVPARVAIWPIRPRETLRSSGRHGTRCVRVQHVEVQEKTLAGMMLDPRQREVVDQSGSGAGPVHPRQVSGIRVDQFREPPRRPVCLANVCTSRDGDRGVPRLAKMFRQGSYRSRQGVGVVDHAVLHHRASAEQGGNRRQRPGGGREDVVEDDAALRQGVEARRPAATAVDADGVSAQRVGQVDEHVRDAPPSLQRSGCAEKTTRAGFSPGSTSSCSRVNGPPAVGKARRWSRH